MVHGLMAGLQSVLAFPVEGFNCPYLGWGVTSSYHFVGLIAPMFNNCDFVKSVICSSRYAYNNLIFLRANCGCKTLQRLVDQQPIQSDYF